MCDKATIERIRAELRKTLLPMEDLRDQVQQSVDIGELLAPQDDIEFLRTAYRKLVGRSPSASCIDRWIGGLKEGTRSRANVIRKLCRSKEGRRCNVKVIGLESVLHDEKKKKIAKRSLWKRFVFKLSSLRNNSSINRKITSVDRRVASLASDWLDVTENIEYQLRQLRSSVRCGDIPSLPSLAGNEHDETSGEIERLVQRMHSTMADAQETIPLSAIEDALQQISYNIDNGQTEYDLRSGWLIAADSIHNVLRGCRSAGIDIAEWLSSPGSVGFIRSSGIKATHAPSLAEFLAQKSLDSSGGIVIESQLTNLDDRELVQCLLIASSVLTPGGQLLIVDPMMDQEFHKTRLQAALEACGFISQPSNNELESKYSGNLIVMAEKPAYSEVCSDS